jgi:hypothetical protein
MKVVWPGDLVVVGGAGQDGVPGFAAAEESLAGAAAPLVLPDGSASAAGSGQCYFLLGFVGLHV